jgi:hypothetical protein
MTDNQRRATAIYVATTVATSAYAAYLETLHKSYDPDWTWLTVVGGNAILGIAFLGVCHAAPPPTSTGYFWHLVGLNCAGGAPIIVWQLWQREQRLREELARQQRGRG